MNNQELIHKFYTSFSNGDATEMVSCYHPEIVFEDPAFGILKGEAAKAMWKMLLSNSKNGLRIKYQDVIANEHTGSAYWIADYLFSQTGRPVNNHIHASFEFKDGIGYTRPIVGMVCLFQKVIAKKNKHPFEKVYGAA